MSKKEQDLQKIFGEALTPISQEEAKMWADIDAVLQQPDDAPLEDLLEAAGITAQDIEDMIANGILDNKDDDQDEWRAAAKRSDERRNARNGGAPRP